MGYTRLTIDGLIYRVRIVYDTYADNFELIEGPNAGDMQSGRRERDLIGTRDVYEMQIEPDPKYPEDFDSLYALLRSPVDSHTVTVFDGQGYLTYAAQIQGGGRTYRGVVGGRRTYGGGVFRFVPSSPQWEASV